MVYPCLFQKDFPGGPQLIEKGLQIAAKNGITGFKRSNGWLEKWKNKYNVKELKVIGESGDVVGETIDSWKERLPEIVHGYSKKISGISMKLVFSGRPCLIVDFQRKESNVRAEKRQTENNCSFYRHCNWKKRNTCGNLEI